MVQMLFDKLKTAMSLLSLLTTVVMVRIIFDKIYTAISLLSLLTTAVMVRMCYLINLHC